MQLADKTVLLTHATNTLGLALAKALDKEGARLLLSSNDESALKQLSSELNSNIHTTIWADINSEVGRFQLVNICQEGSTSVDILINNPAKGAQGSFRGVTQGAISEYINTSLTAPMLLTRIMLPRLITQTKAQIVNIGTLSASIGLPGFAIDCAGRFGLRGFSEALAREFANTPVDVIYIAHRGLARSDNDVGSPGLNATLKNPLDKPDAIAKKIIKAMKRNSAFTQLGWRQGHWIKMNTASPERITKRLLKHLPAFAHFARQKTSLKTQTRDPDLDPE